MSKTNESTTCRSAYLDLPRGQRWRSLLKPWLSKFLPLESNRFHCIYTQNVCSSNPPISPLGILPLWCKSSFRDCLHGNLFPAFPPCCWLCVPSLAHAGSWSNQEVITFLVRRVFITFLKQLIVEPHEHQGRYRVRGEDRASAAWDVLDVHIRCPEFPNILPGKVIIHLKENFLCCCNAQFIR